MGIAFGQHNDIAAEAVAGVIPDANLEKVDKFLDVGRRLRTFALHTAVLGIAGSLLAMTVAAADYLPPLRARWRGT